MGLLDHVLPGRRAKVDVKDALEKTRAEQQDVKTILQRTERLERRFFVDNLFPGPQERRGREVVSNGYRH